MCTQKLTNSQLNLPHGTKQKQVRQQACKTQIPSYGLSRRRRPQFRASLHATADVTPLPPRNALVHRRHSSNRLQRGHTIRTEDGWVGASQR